MWVQTKDLEFQPLANVVGLRLGCTFSGKNQRKGWVLYHGSLPVAWEGDDANQPHEHGLIVCLFGRKDSSLVIVDSLTGWELGKP